ncbi:MAG: hypothetical protein DME26_23135 [Verrucomicrobia bacterium]|nr:MAG: hypothetical protein DME26_23135 [Verrucomicrobiota bacterium]
MATLIFLGLLSTLLFWNLSTPAIAQDAQNTAEKKDQAETQKSAAQEPTKPNASAAAAKLEPATAPAVSPGAAEAPPPAITEKTPSAAASAETGQSPPTNDIPLAFQGANVDMIVKWLAETTGKSVVKHPKVQCQLTIVSSKKLSPRDAINLVYRALSLEGFAVIESSKSILIVPEAQEPKMSPELIESSRTEIPEGRQRLMKIFPLKNIQAAELMDKIRSVLSDKAIIELAERGNQIIVTDYTENIRVLAELIKELDLPAGGDTVIEFYSLKHSEADELANLLTLILNAPSAALGQGMPGQPPPGQPMPGQPMPGQPQPGLGQPSPGRPSQSPSAGGAQAGQQIRIWPDKTSNRLIVAAPKTKLPEVERLINLLDTEKPQDVTIRVLQLKNVAADDLVRELGPLFQKMSGKSVKEVIEVTANTRANSLIVLSSESNFKAIEKLVSSLDTEEAQEKVTRAFPLKNAEAEDVAKQLQDLNQDQDSSSRYPFFIFGMSQSQKGPKKPTFVADRRRNTVIVQASPAAIENIAKLIVELDEPVADNALAPKIFRLKYVSATDIEDVLNELFIKRQSQRTYWDPYGFPTRQTDEQGNGRLAGKIRITSEPYANAIIVTANSPENLAAVEEVLKQLDVPSQAGETTFRIGLRFAKASTVANNINILFARAGSPPLRQTAQQGQPGVPVQPQQQQVSSSKSGFDLEQEAKEDTYFPWLGGPAENLRSADGRNTIRPISDLVGRVRAVPDGRSNSLLISANLHLYPQVLKLIEELDAPTAQVLIEAKLVEVSSDFLDKLGVRWSPDGSKVFTADDFDNSLLARATAQYTKGFGGPTTVNTPGAGVVGQALASLRSGVLDSTINMDFLVQFLRKTTDATVLAEPQINIKDNETGRLFVGQQVPIPANTQVSSVGSQSTAITYKDVGVVLEVTPHINTAGDVELKIHAESSTVVPGQTVLGGALFDTRNFRTDLRAKNGQTLVLGGIIQRQVSDTLRKTPVLGSIPAVGWAFKKKDKTAHEVELMVFLRPKVVRTPEEAQELLEEVDKKAPLIKKWQDDVPLKEQNSRKNSHK